MKPRAQMNADELRVELGNAEDETESLRSRLAEKWDRACRLADAVLERREKT